MPKLIFAAPDPVPEVIERLLPALDDECRALGIVSEAVVGEQPGIQANAVAVALCTADALPTLDLEHGLPMLGLLIGGEGTGPDDRNANSDRSAPALGALMTSAAVAFTTDLQGSELLGALGIQADRLQCGYTRRWDHRKLIEERDVDLVVHVPTRQERRGAAGRLAPHEAAGRLAAQLAHLDVRVLLSERALTDAGPPGFEPADRRGLFLARARCFVALGEGAPCWIPCVEAMLAGCAVVAEDPRCLAPLRPGRELVGARADAIAQAVTALLRDARYRQRLTSRAYLALRLEFSMHRALSQLYQAARIAVQAQSRSASDAAHVAEQTLPITDPDQARTAEPDQPPTTDSAQEPATDPDQTDGARRYISKARSVRWGFEPRALRITATSPGYACGAPALSVLVIVAQSHSQRLHETLDSLLAIDECSTEIVIIEDVAADPDAGEWISAHPKQLALALRRSTPSGVRAARRAALELAKARHCLMLDAGILIAPHAVCQLREGLAIGVGLRMINGLVALGQEGLDENRAQLGSVCFGRQSALLDAVAVPQVEAQPALRAVPAIVGFAA